LIVTDDVVAFVAIYGYAKPSARTDVHASLPPNTSFNEIGNDITTELSVGTETSNPPWVQVGNDADPDERYGSFTENRQNWKRCPDAG